MRNPCLEAALRELSDAGIRDVERAQGGKHLQLRWRVNGGQQRMYSLSATPSDVRAAANTRADIRRMLKADGPLPDQTKPTAAPAVKPAKPRTWQEEVRRLEAEIGNLKARVVRLENGDADDDSAPLI
jgi:hypothetical protein